LYLIAHSLSALNWLTAEFDGETLHLLLGEPES
jgi:hypothetical protein